MAMSLQEQLRAKRAETERWIRAREMELRRAAAGAEARGRQAYAAAIRTGEKVLARTPAEIRALGIAAAQGRLPQAVGEAMAKKVVQRGPAVSKAAAKAQPPARATSKATAVAPKIVRQLEAGLSGAVDEASFGLADRALSAGEAIGAAIRDGELHDLGQDYHAGMAARRAQDDYDAKHHALARNTGRVVGLGLGVAATGPAGAAIKAGMKTTPAGAKLLAHVAKTPRLKGIDPRGLTGLAAGGGATAGVIGQLATDAITGNRSSLGDLAAAGLGGGLGGVATLRRGAVRGGLVGGAATSALGDVFDGRLPSVEGAIKAGHVGAVVGGATAGLGTYGSAALPSRIKGEIGEGMSLLRSVARGRLPTQNARVELRGGGYSVPDQTIGHDLLGRKLDELEYLEVKLGPAARLSCPQERLRAENPGRFAIDAWKFTDVGKMISAAGAQAGPQAADDRRFP